MGGGGMTLHVYDFEQRTDEWYDARRGIVTASTVGRLLTPTLEIADNEGSRALTRLLVAERITGHTDPTYQNDDMFRGVMEEPRARDVYSGHYAEAVECGFMRLEESWGTLGYSPDGVVGDDGLIEVKAPEAKEHLRTILADEVPACYMAQCQAGLLVSGRDWIDYLSFCGGMPMWRKRVLPDPEWQAAIVAAVEAFEQTAAEMTERLAKYRESVVGLPG
jgi:hypothetical protein